MQIRNQHFPSLDQSPCAFGPQRAYHLIIARLCLIGIYFAYEGLCNQTRQKSSLVAKSCCSDCLSPSLWLQFGCIIKLESNSIMGVLLVYFCTKRSLDTAAYHNAVQRTYKYVPIRYFVFRHGINRVQPLPHGLVPTRLPLFVGRVQGSTFGG